MNNKNNKVIKTISILGTILIFIGIIMSITDILFSPPKKIINNEINKTFNALKRIIKDQNNSTFQYDLKNDSVGIEGNIKLNINTAENNYDYSKLNNTSLSYSGVLDQKNNKANINLSINDSTQKLVGVNSYIEGKNFKMDLEDLYDKIIQTTIPTEIKELDLDNRVDLNNYIVIIDKTNKYTQEYITSLKETKSNVSNQTKTSYQIKENEFKKYLLKKYLEDEEILKKINNITETSISDIKENINNIIQELNEEENTDSIEISVYKAGLSLKKIDISFITLDYFTEKNNTRTISIEPKNNIYNYKIIENNKELGHGEYNKLSKTINYNINNEYGSTKITLTINNKIIKLDYDFNDKIIENSKSNMQLTIETQTTNKSQNTKVNFEYKTIQNGQTNSITLNNSNTITKNKKVSELNNSKETVDIENISPQDQQNITNRLYEKMSKIINIPEDLNYELRKAVDNIF
ncbi:MAG: hypothetical protein IJ842_03055 [Bacilli bacterium]|nr:hypothetical protein [Bacilli bacterium]